jgi:hypothetical protein
MALGTGREAMGKTQTIPTCNQHDSYCIGKLFLEANMRGRLERPDTESGTPQLWPMN